MNTLMQPLQEWREKITDFWLAKTVRERQLLGLVGCLLMVWSLYFLVVHPVQTGLEEAQQHVTSSQRQYEQVINTAKKIAQLQASAPNAVTSGNQSLDVLVNRAASSAGITITGLNRQQDGLQVRMNPTPFDKLVQWITALENQNVDVSSLQISRTEKPGIVEVQQIRVERVVL